MGTYGYLTFTKTARQAFDLSERLNEPEYQEGILYGTHYVLKLSQPTMTFDKAPGCLDYIMARYAVAWSGKAGLHAMAGEHAKHTLTLDEMIEERGNSEDWARNPEAFGTKISREQLAEEAYVTLPKTVWPEPKSPSPTELPPGPWRVEFDSHGGYDCLSAGYAVRDNYDQIVVVVDVGNFLTQDQLESEMANAEHPVARAVAERIALIGGAA